MYVTIYLYRPNRNEETFVIHTSKLKSTKDMIEDKVNQQQSFIELDELEVNEVLRAKSSGLTHLVLDVHQIN